MYVFARNRNRNRNIITQRRERETVKRCASEREKERKMS